MNAVTVDWSAAARHAFDRVEGRPLFHAGWRRTVFIHYEVDPAALQPQVPFPLDTREGKAYVSLVAFTLADLRFAAGGPPFSTHGFLNVRAYTRDNGIYFLSEWLPNPFCVFLGPRLYGLPYRRGRLDYAHLHESGRLHGRVEDRGGALEYDAAVDPRTLVAALTEALQSAGGEIRRERVTDLTTLPADQVVVAAGAWSGRLGALPIRPVKGQIMRLRDPQGQDLVTRTIRTREGYLVPRGEGRYVLGATVEERGWDTAPTAGATHELIRDLAEVVPGVLELEIEELGAGLRPGTPDNLPIIGEHGGVVWATGHFRNGILLADVTAQAVAELLTGNPLPEWAAACDPARFAEVAA